MPSEKDKILEFNQYMKSDKMPHVIESLIKKIVNVKIIQKILQ